MTTDQLTDRTRDPLELLTLAAPTTDSLAREWTPARADDVLAATARRAGDPGSGAGTTLVLVPRRSRRRWVGLGAAAAAAALVVLAGTTVLAPDTALPRADAVEQLARAAALAPALEVGEGQYLHQVVQVTQQDGGAGTPAVDTTSESWVDAQGTTWRRDVSRVDPVGTFSYRFPASDLGDDPFTGTRPADYRQWPTDPEALRSFLDAHIRGDGPNVLDPSQSIFEDLSDRFVSGTTPPGLNAAMIRVLGSLPQVATSRVSFAGRDAVQLEYRGAYVDALYFDQQTAQWLGETAHGERTEVRGRPRLVAAVPAEVRRTAVVEGHDDASAGSAG